MARYFRLDMILVITALSTCGLVLTGCGNILALQPKEDDLMVGYPDTLEDENYADYSCQADYTIKPVSDFSGTGIKNYKGCGSTQSAWKAIAIAKDSATQRVCVYPAQYIDASHLFLKPDITQPGKYLSSCVTLGTAGPNAAAVEFENVNYNYFFIVEEVNHAQVEQCLSNMDLQPCEAILSKGKFR